MQFGKLARQMPQYGNAVSVRICVCLLVCLLASYTETLKVELRTVLIIILSYTPIIHLGPSSIEETVDI